MIQTELILDLYCFSLIVLLFHWPLEFPVDHDNSISVKYKFIFVVFICSVLFSQSESTTSSFHLTDSKLCMHLYLICPAPLLSSEDVNKCCFCFPSRVAYPFDVFEVKYTGFLINDC